MVNSITSSPSDSTPVSRSDSGPAAAGGASAAQRAGAGSWLRAEFLYLAILITQLPAALGYLKRVWGSGHYQFAVLLIPIAIWLMTSRLESVPRATTRSMPVLMLGLLGLIVTMVLSTFIAPMFWILFLLVLVVGGLVNYVVSRLVDKTGISGTDRVLGGLFGIVRADDQDMALKPIK